MKALILNSGLGMRMRSILQDLPKCMTEISAEETILKRQLKLLCDAGVTDIIMTTGYFDDVLVDYCNSLPFPLKYTFIKNPLFATTNYIYSIYCAREVLKDQDIVLMHGDLVFEPFVLEKILSFKTSCMKISSTLPLPEKDFKAVIDKGRIKKVGVEFFEDNAVEAQALYKLQKKDWNLWLNKICEFCRSGQCNCYAEKAFNEISEKCLIFGCDVQDYLCTEIDTVEDLAFVTDKLALLNKN